MKTRGAVLLEVPGKWEIVELEDRADDITREVMLAVRMSFITPFDRGDIKDLIQSMDDAIDMMNKVVKMVRLFEQMSFEPRMKEMGAVIVEAAHLTAEAIPLLEKVGANVTRLSALAEEIIKVEERADGLHDAGLKELESMPAIDSLDVSDTKVTDGGIAEFRKMRPRCKVKK